MSKRLHIPYRPRTGTTVRAQRRLIKKEKDEVFAALVYGFFSDITGKNEAEVRDLYRRYERVWIARCATVNEGKKTILLHKDAFENAIKIKGHVRIKQSKVSSKAKIYALSLLHPIQGKSKSYYFFRDLGLWINYILFEFKLA